MQKRNVWRGFTSLRNIFVTCLKTAQLINRKGLKKSYPRCKVLWFYLVPVYRKGICKPNLMFLQYYPVQVLVPCWPNYVFHFPNLCSSRLFSSSATSGFFLENLRFGYLLLQIFLSIKVIFSILISWGGGEGGALSLFDRTND